MNKVRPTELPPCSKQDAYAAIVARIHEHIDRAIPAGSTVAIVSKGDDRLLQIEPCRGWHFPQNSEGTYAGYYPENDMAAISHLEALRSRGAQFFVVPVTASWWFDHYSGFHRHLRALYAVLLCDNETCTIFDLRGKRESLSFAPAVSITPFHHGSLRQLREIVECLLPESSTVAVLSRLDTPGLELGGRRTFRLEPGPRSHREDLTRSTVSEVGRWVQAAMCGGAEFLVLLEPSTWGMADRPRFTGLLPTSARLVTHQPHVCVIFEVRS